MWIVTNDSIPVVLITLKKGGMTKILLEGKKDVGNKILTFYPSLDPKNHLGIFYNIHL